MLRSATPSISAGAPRPAGATRIRFRVLGLLVVLSFVAYLLRTNMSVAGDGVMTELGLSQTEFGFVLGAFAWGYAIFQFPGGLFGQRFGGRRALAWIAVAWGAATLAIGVVPGGSSAWPAAVTVGWLVVARFAMGLFQAPLFPVVAGLIEEWFPKAGWALPNGLSSAGTTLGAAASAPLVAWIVLVAGWRASFLWLAPLALLAAAWWWASGRDRPAEHPGVGAAELALVRAGRADSAGAADVERSAGAPAGVSAWRLVLRDRNVLRLTLSYFCANYVFYIFFNWFFLYLVQVRGFDELSGGFLATVPWLVGAGAAVAGGLVCDRLSRSRGIRLGCRLPCLVTLVSAAALLWAGAVVRSPLGAVALLGLCFGCIASCEGPYWSAVTSVAGRHTAAAAGLLNTGGNLVGGFGAVLVPFLAERYGWILALSTGSLFALAGAALWLFIRADEPLALGGRAG